MTKGPEILKDKRADQDLDKAIVKSENDLTLLEFRNKYGDNVGELLEQTVGTNKIANNIEDTRSEIEKLEGMTEAIKGIQKKADWLDKKGLDVLISLLPIAGDTASALASCYIIFCARQELDLPWMEVGKMLGVLGLDTLLGSMTPPGADIFVDYLFQANRINVLLMKRVLRQKIEEAEKKGVEVPDDIKDFAEIDLRKYMLEAGKKAVKKFASKNSSPQKS